MTGVNEMNKFTRPFIAALAIICLSGVRCATPPRPGSRPVYKPSLTAENIKNYLGERWYGIYFKEQKIGYARSEISQERYEGKPAITVAFTFHAQVKMLGVPQEMTITEKRTYVLGEGLAFFISDTNAGESMMKFIGRMKNGTMHVTSIVGGKQRSSTVEIPRERFEDYIAEERLVKEGATVGDEISFSQYQPALQKTITAVSRIKEIQEKIMQGVPTETYVVETTLKEMGVTSTSVLQSDGEVLQAEVGGGFIMRLEDEKTAKNIDYRSDIILSTVITPNRPIENPSEVTEMRARLSGVKDRSLFIQSERQRYAIQPRGDALLIVNIEDLSDIEIPQLPLEKADFPSDLEPSIFVQSDAPEIISKARAIVGDECDALEASDAIVKWVYENLTKRFSASFSNALDVLASRGGDCTEHSVLYVALARAAGLPAREVSGIVYSGDDDGFYYHQWAEAFVGKWIAVDPTFGQSQADATHIKFASGDLLSQAKLLNLIGALKIEILEYSYDSKD
jgi:hypothetical protein